MQMQLTGFMGKIKENGSLALIIWMNYQIGLKHLINLKTYQGI